MNRQIKIHIIRYILFVLVILLCIKIYTLSSESGATSTNTSHNFIRSIILIFNKNLTDTELDIRIEQLEPLVRKIAHFSIYGLLGILIMSCSETYKCKDQKKIAVSLIIAFAYAVSDEIHQRFVPNRSGEIRDVIIDTCGAFLGIIFVWFIDIIFKVARSRKKGLNENRHSSETSQKKVLFIASTGGHLNELLQVKSLFNKYQYHIITEKTKIDKSLKEEYRDKVSYLIYGTKKYPIKYLFKFTANCFISLFYFFKYQPEVVVTTGTHTAVPMCYIAKIFGSKIIFIETFANRTTGTVSGRIVYPIADVFVVQWEEMFKIYPKAECWGWIY